MYTLSFKLVLHCGILRLTQSGAGARIDEIDMSFRNSENQVSIRFYSKRNADFIIKTHADRIFKELSLYKM